MTHHPPNVALVTGGGRRLGALLCQELAGMGFAVAVAYQRAAEPAQRLAEAIRASGGEALALPLDLTNPDAAAVLLDAIAERLGPLRLVVHNAGAFAPTPVTGGDWSAMSTLFQINLQGPLWLSLQAATRMRANGGGQIIHIADLWGERPLAGHVAYCAAKAGVLMATQVLARDLAPLIRVNAIAPGAILPPDPPASAEPFQTLLRRTPLADHATPRAVVEAVRYLLAAPFVTGEILHVDGGRRLG
ncbi:MAG: SDR family NAD(P)-dependent oxidoreductase [Magnetococcales bacterium]|nr:SDR family NAD(P)-dependent oxidoreductase [Magnetococcales bacterium]